MLGRAVKLTNSGCLLLGSVFKVIGSGTLPPGSGLKSTESGFSYIEGALGVT